MKTSAGNEEISPRLARKAGDVKCTTALNALYLLTREALGRWFHPRSIRRGWSCS
jgi:hypothetical protein